MHDAHTSTTATIAHIIVTEKIQDVETTTSSNSSVDADSLVNSDKNDSNLELKTNETVGFGINVNDDICSRQCSCEKCNADTSLGILLSPNSGGKNEQHKNDNDIAQNASSNNQSSSTFGAYLLFSNIANTDNTEWCKANNDTVFLVWIRLTRIQHFLLE